MQQRARAWAMIELWWLPLALGRRPWAERTAASVMEHLTQVTPAMQNVGGEGAEKHWHQATAKPKLKNKKKKKKKEKWQSQAK